MGQRRGVPESGVSAAADAAAGASWHAELPQPGRDAVLGQEGEPVGGRAGKLSRGPADGPEAATGRGAGQVLHETAPCLAYSEATRLRSMAECSLFPVIVISPILYRRPSTTAIVMIRLSGLG